MRFSEILSVALASLRATKGRAFLTALGIVIGVGAVITMIALGSGAQAAVEAQLAALGTDRLTISPGQSFVRGAASAERARLTIDDAEALKEASSLIAVAPILTGRQQLKIGENNGNVDVIATVPQLEQIDRYELVAGRFISEGDQAQRKQVVVLGADIPEELRLGEVVAADLVGRQVQIRGINFEVIGVLGQYASRGRDDPNESVFIPLSTGQFRIFGSDRIQRINAKLVAPERMNAGILDIEQILRREHRLRPDATNDFRIQDNSEFLTAQAEAGETLTFLLAGIAAVSLIVGGIGIMNIMLVSVTERTREIGVRKALGATRRNVLIQFLLEAMTLCLIGGVVGVAMGYGAAMFLGRLNGWPMEVSMDSILLAVGFSAAIGIFFGVWPARRAARLDPIEALRYE
ncbi:MAG: ABC transporter permease [Gemmatimonadaceae bacterium]|nr:ABC transporter permease [Gemmatimonadaceae bacterium]